MKHVEGIFGWYEKIWLHERDFYKFFFINLSSETGSVKERLLVL